VKKLIYMYTFKKAILIFGPVYRTSTNQIRVWDYTVLFEFRSDSRFHFGSGVTRPLLWAYTFGLLRPKISVDYNSAIEQIFSSGTLHGGATGYFLGEGNTQVAFTMCLFYLAPKPRWESLNLACE